MSKENPYEPPKSEVATTEAIPENIANHLVKSQKFLIFAIIFFIIGIFSAELIGLPAALLLIIGAFVLGVLGFIRAMIGINLGAVSIIILGIGMFIPLFNIFVLVRLNGKVTNKLRASGYKIGLFGAKK